MLLCHSSFGQKQLIDQAKNKNYDDNHFSRILIYDQEPDRIKGFVLRSELLLPQARGNDDSLLSNYQRNLSKINSETSVLNAYEILLSKREKILLLINFTFYTNVSARMSMYRHFIWILYKKIELKVSTA